MDGDKCKQAREDICISRFPILKSERLGKKLKISRERVSRPNNR